MSEMDVNCTKFGKGLKKLRGKRKFSQESFANHASFSRSYYGRLERGEVDPSLSTLCRIAKGLRLHPAELLRKTL